MKQEINEKALLQGLARNETKSVETIYRENYNTVHALIINNNGSSDEAKDVFQEAMIVLYEKVQEGGFILSSRLKTFLYSVCRRLWLKKLQSGSLSGPIFEELEETTAAEDALEAHLERDRQFRQMEEAMGKIGEPCKTILEDYYIHRQSMQEIAERFGYTNAENAKNQKYKCLMRLKKLFFAPYK